ncbi:Uncharacterized protein DAT39_015930 [Clarias magur]|uniref:Uncharacterized protein n=1 Tax=Clarias magur TaxID=1594786 RepID=A0A8J4TPB3_CLAMG|nr:Uncharacterized protein DAT39_015930 [Clarias magur]
MVALTWHARIKRGQPHTVPHNTLTQKPLGLVEANALISGRSRSGAKGRIVRELSHPKTAFQWDKFGGAEENVGPTAQLVESSYIVE